MRWRDAGRCGRAVTPDLSALLSAARGLVPVGCALGVADPRADWPPFPGEVVRGVPKRIAEFRAGREAARTALAELGLPARPLPAAPDRTPIWPMGIAGSITHSERLCLAVAGRFRGIGVDLEPAVALPADLRDSVLVTEEVAATDHEAKLIFAAKEAVYKAQYALTRQLLGFDSVAVTITPGRFTARFRQEVGAIPVGRVVEGRWTDVAGHYLTLIWL